MANRLDKICTSDIIITLRWMIMYVGPYLELETTVSPQIVLTSEILQLPAADLEGRISRELAENPALERIESFHCILCGMPVAEGRRLCYYCAQRPRTRDNGPDE